MKKNKWKNILQLCKKSNKDTEHKKKNCHKNWWIVCIYVFIPIILIWCLDSIFLPILFDFMSGIEIGGGMLLNSKYSIDKIVYPFCKVIILIIGFIMSYIILNKIQNELLEKRIYFVAAKNCLKWFECVTVLVAVVIAIYGKVDSFEYYQYGFNVNTIEKTINNEQSALYIPLEEIPSINSEGIKIQDGNLLYNVILKMSQGLFHISDNFEIIIAIAGAVIFPLRNYAESIDYENIIKDNKNLKN